MTSDDNNNNNDDETKKIEAVAERLTFFFSDANLRQDKFLQRELSSVENSGFVPLKTLLKFKTIKRITMDEAIVAKAAKVDSAKDVVKLNEKEDGIGRVVPFDSSTVVDRKKLTLYVENLPMEFEEKKEDVKKEEDEEEKDGGDGDKKEEEEKKPKKGGTPKKYAVHFNDVKKLFDEYGKVSYVKLRFYFPSREDADDHDKYNSPENRKRAPAVPIGSAFVEFATEEEQKKAAKVLVAEEGKEEEVKILELGGRKLRVKTMQGWIDAKEKRKAERKKNGGGDDDKKQISGKKHSRDAEDEDGEKAKKEAGAKEDDDDKMEEDKSSESSPKVEVEEFKYDWKKGCVISIKGLPENCDREAIRETVMKYLGLDDVKTSGIYADFSRGQEDGAVRFNDPNDKIGDIADKLQKGELEIGGSKIESAKVLEGEEEEAYWKNFIEFKTKQIRHKAENKANKRARTGGFGRRGRGGRGGRGRR